MTLYVRKWNCACCDQPVVYDSLSGDLSCGCGAIHLAVKPLDLNLHFTKWAVPLKVKQ